VADLPVGSWASSIGLCYPDHDDRDDGD